jgi:hypothetical protein
MVGIMCAPPGSALIGQTSTLVIAGSPDRTGLFIRNMSNKNVYLAFAHPAEIGKGVVLYPSESYVMGPTEFSFEDVSAISDGANSEITFQHFGCRIT